MERLGKRPGLLAFVTLGIYFAMFLVGSFADISKEGLELIDGMTAQVGTLLTVLVSYAVKDALDEKRE